MNEMVVFYEQQAQKNLSSQLWLAELQKDAINLFQDKGFPNRHDEEWKYTPLDFLNKNSFATLKDASIPQSLQSDIPVSQKIYIANGHIIGLEELSTQLPAGVLVLPLSEALVQHSDLVKTHLGKILDSKHSVHALNTAMIQCGLFVYVPKGIVLNQPIALVHYQEEAQHAAYLRHVVVAEEGSEISLVEDYIGEEDCVYLTNTVMEVFVAPRAKVTHYTVQRESKAAYHLGHVAVKQGAHSEFAHHSLSLGGKLVRSDLSIALQEPHARCLMNGVYAPADGQHVDHHTTVHHLVPDCISDQDYKGILAGSSRAVFNGKVIVAKNAQHTAATQQNKNVLLSANSEIDTKPQLEIFADDVVCSHGATVGQLDEEALFFLATRGIDRLEASHYLIQAFAQDNLQRIPHRELADWMRDLINQQVE